MTVSHSLSAEGVTLAYGDRTIIDGLDLQILQRLSECPSGGRGLVEGVVELAGDEHLVTGKTAVGDGPAHVWLVAVHLGGIDVPISRIERGPHARIRLR